MSKKISELTELTIPATDDELVIVDNSEVETKKITLSNLKASGTDIDTGTEDVKFVTPKAINDSTKIAQTDEDTTFQESLIAGGFAGKNLFNKNSLNTILGYPDVSTQVMILAASIKSFYIKIEPNTTYTVSKVSSFKFRIATTVAVPANGVATSAVTYNDTATSLSITTSATAQYLVVYYYSSVSDTLTEQEILDTIQVELGSTATTYYPYQDFKQLNTPIVALFSGTSALGSAITLNESIYNFSQIIVKCDNAGIYMSGPIVKWFGGMAQITAGGFQPATNGQYVASVYLTPSNGGLTLTSDSNSNYISVTTTPTVTKTALNNITNIWGIR